MSLLLQSTARIYLRAVTKKTAQLLEKCLMTLDRKGKFCRVCSLDQVANHTSSLEKTLFPLMGHGGQLENAAGRHWADVRRVKFSRVSLG